MQTALKSLRRRSVLRWTFIASVALAAMILAIHIPRTLGAFTLGAFIAFGLIPVVEWLTRRGLPRPFAIATAYAGLIAAIGILVVLVVPATIEQVQILAQNAPDYALGAQHLIDDTQAGITARFGRVNTGTTDVHKIISDRFGQLINASASSAYQILVGTFTTAFIIITALVLSAFFVGSGRAVAEPFYAVLPPARQAYARQIGREIAEVFGNYVVGQVTLCALVGALVWVCALITGLKFGTLVGVISGVAYAVPFVGQIAAHLVAAVLGAPQGLQTVLWSQIALFIVFRVADNLLAPKVFANSVGVPPAVVIFAVFAGGELFGLPGLLLGIPAAALLRILYKYLVAPQLERRLEAVPSVPTGSDPLSEPVTSIPVN